MKNTSLLFVFVLVLFSSYSQIEKGTKSFGISFNSDQLSGQHNSSSDISIDSESRSFSFGASPNFSLFVKNNFSIGLGLGYSYSKSNDKDYYPMGESYVEKSIGNGYTASLNSSYYFQLDDRVYFSITGAFSYNRTIINNTEIHQTDFSTEEIKTTQYSNVFSLQFNPSILYFIRPQLGLKATFGNLYYTIQRGKINDATYDNHNYDYSYGLNLSSSSFSFGLNYYFK